ncbi:cyclin-T isoform X2 [Odontomachus brunneus]|uniref:cyclin-T isoform X2 n=1 Tax=Odontomachus brunneus TaxID=486640 RepID=UPI0013F1B06D|nr:cyclin-T isoform X2 [Odontomachus brunneus]
MATDEKWYFTKEQLANTPSRRCGIDADKELSYRQQAANFIQDMGQRLMVSQLCINTAIVYMHRFYVFHSLTQFHRNAIAVAALFLAAKVEEQPRKLEHVIKMAYMCLHREQGPDGRSEQFLEQAQDLVFNENVLLQTLGFDVAIDHPHTHVVRCCQLVKASKDLAQTSYFMASNSLHLTTMCLQYKPTVVACFCIHLACKWSNWEIPQSNEGKHWFWYVDKSVTSELLQQLTAEFLHIFDKCPSRLKKKIMSISANQSPNMHHPSLSNSPFDTEPHKIQSPATTLDGGGSASHSSRPHHSQEKQEKPDDKKAGVASSSSRPIDYREYREKKERERLEREKAAPASTSTQGHITDPSKHHSHHHKAVANASVPNKHQLPSVQKSSLHHNHHHRPDMKVNQPVSQRHSAGTQAREASRDPNRQRLPREYNVGGTSTGVAHPSRDVSLDAALDAVAHRTEAGTTQDTNHGNSQEKPSSNNNYNLHRLNALDGKQQPYDKRMHDPRHSKPADHKKDSEQKTYGGKYPDLASRVDRQQRKSDILEQKCEEVRKLIEKPLPPPPKPAEVPYMLNAQKQAHHSKYDKSLSASHTADVKHSAMGQGALPQDKSPSAPTLVSAASQVSQKSTPARSAHNQHSAYGVSQILKDTIKNGSSQACLSTLNNVDDSKPEKRPRMHDDSEKTSVDVQQLTPPTSRHRSLFSPEAPTTREPHAQRPKSKQRTPPSAARAIKQERVSPFASPPTTQQQDSSAMKRPSNDSMTAPPHKRPRTTSTGENTGEHSVKVKTEDPSSLEAMRMLGRVPELIQPIRDAPLSTTSGRTSSSAIISADVKPSEQLVKYELDAIVPRLNATMTQHKVSSMSVQTLPNGLDPNAVVKQEPLEHHVKKEPHRIQQAVTTVKSEHPHSHSQQPRLEYSPMKSAQSISALLQEPLAPMPSLLQTAMQQQQHGQTHNQQMHSDLLQQQSAIHLLTNQQLPMTTSSSLSVSTTSDTSSIISTVDMSALSCVPLTHRPSGTEPTSVSLPVVPPTPAVPAPEEKRSDHHKSEKKKKEKKHKHKDKDKSREKHKHKHKDKDKEKHREKDKERSEETPSAAPIKITIPKDKLNLSTEAPPSTNIAAGSSAALPDKNKSPQSTGLKIKIPKERLKGADSMPSSPAQPMVQGPLKIKIRTDSIARGSTAPTSLSPQAPLSQLSTPVSSSSSGTASSSHATSESVNESMSRKRERTDQTESGPTTSGQSSAKKQSQLAAAGYGQGHRPGERQNGRHYSSGSSNKVRGGGRGARHYSGRAPPPLATGPYAASSQRSGDGYYQRDSYGSKHARNQPPYPHQSIPTLSPAVRGDLGYARGGHAGQARADQYFFANYPSHTMYNPAGYMFDPAFYQQHYQQYQQQQAFPSMYSAGGVIMTPEGAIDTSVPPPSMLPNLRRGQTIIHQPSVSAQQDAASSLPPPPPPPPPLPCGPPPSSTPPPPPPSSP